MSDFPDLSEDEKLEDRGLAKSVGLLRSFAELEGGKQKRIIFDFFARPLSIEGDGRAEKVLVERTRLEDGRAVGTGETYEVAADLVVSCIGYSSPIIPGVPYDNKGGKFLNTDGKIDDRLYCVGWARRGPTGTIGTNRPDGFEVADHIAAAMEPGSDGGRKGGAGLDALLAERDIEATDYDDWRRIEAAETAAARPGSPREKFVRHDQWLDVLKD